MLQLRQSIPQAHSDIGWSVQWNPRGTLLASCSTDKSVKIWSYHRPNQSSLSESNDVSPILKLATTLSMANHSRTIRAVAFNCDDILATAGFDATVGIYKPTRKSSIGDTLEYEHVCQLSGHENEVKSVAWSAGGCYLATCGRDKSVWVWMMDADCDFECVAVLQSHTQDVKMVKWHPRDDILVSCSYDNSIKIWLEDEEDWYCADTLKTEATVWCVEWVKKSQTVGSGYDLLSVGDDQCLRVWSANEKGRFEMVRVIENLHTRSIYSISAWSNERHLIATASADDDIKIVDLSAEEGLVVAHWERGAHESDVNCVSWRPARQEDASQNENNSDLDKILVSVGDDGTIKVWQWK